MFMRKITAQIFHDAVLQLDISKLFMWNWYFETRQQKFKQQLSLDTFTG